MKPGRIVALIAGCLLIIPALGIIFGGVGVTAAYGFGRDDDGYFDVTLDRLGTSTVALVARDVTLESEPGSPDWVLDAIDLDTRLRVANTTDGEVFVGIARDEDVDAYFEGVAYDEIVDIDGTAANYRSRSGRDEIAPPGDQGFWAESQSGPGTQQVDWSATSGRWAVVLMNADASA